MRARQDGCDRTEGVGLNEQQKDAVLAAYLARGDQTGADAAKLRESGNFNMTAYREVRDKAENTYQAALQQIMTAQQYETYVAKWRQTDRQGIVSGAGPIQIDLH